MAEQAIEFLHSLCLSLSTAFPTATLLPMCYTCLHLSLFMPARRREVRHELIGDLLLHMCSVGIAVAIKVSIILQSNLPFQYLYTHQTAGSMLIKPAGAASLSLSSVSIHFSLYIIHLLFPSHMARQVDGPCMVVIFFCWKFQQ